MFKNLPVVTVLPFDEQLIALALPTYSKTIVELIKGVEGSYWDRPHKLWMCPREKLGAMIKALSNVPVKLAPGIEVPREEGMVLRPTANLGLIESYQFKTAPYKHQGESMALGIEKKTFAFLMEMGTGKTKAQIDVFSFLMLHGFVSGAFIFTKKAVMYTWQREIITHSPLPPEKRVSVVLTGSTDHKRKLLRHYAHTAQFFITNYETLLALGDEIREIAKARAMACTLDESTAIKTHSSKVAKECHELAPLCPFRYIMTGTPITQGPLDAFSQFKFLDPNILGHHNYFSFKNEYAIFGGFKQKEIVGYKNLERLQKRIAPWSYRVLKKECLDLPEKVYQILEVDLSDEARAMYRQMREESIIELDGKFAAAPVILTKLLRLQQITSGFLPLHDDTGQEVDRKELPCAKHDAIVDVVETAVEAGQKVIVWCRFIHDIEKLSERLAEYGVVQYHGEVKESARQKAIDDFQSDPTVRVFIGQIQTGGLGITLTAASVEVYASNTFTLADRLQSEDRAHRIGQKNTVTIIDVVARKTVDEFILKTLNNKKSLADVITGDSLREAAGDV